MEKIKNLIREIEYLPDTKKGIDLKPIKIAMVNMLKEYDNK